MGSLFTPSVPTPPPAPEVEEYNFTSEVSGVQREIVTAPDGTKTIVETALPLSAEEQEYQDNLKRIGDESLQWIENLSTNYDSDSIPWLKEYLTSYEETARINLDESVVARTDYEEKSMARYGVEDSTAAVQSRQQRGKDFQEASDQIGRDMQQIEQDARTDSLNKAQSLYGIATGRQDLQLNTMLGGLSSGASQSNYLTNMGNNNALSNYNAHLLYNQQRAAASAQGMNTFGKIVGIGVGAATGGMGGFGA